MDHGDVSVNLGGQRGTEGQMMGTRAEPESRQQQDFLWHALFGTFRDRTYQDRVGERGQMSAVLFTSSDRGQDDHTITWDSPK